MGSLGFPELMLILLIVIIIFGASRLPQLGRGLGEGISNFRDGLKGKDQKNDHSAPAEEKKNG
ncbi:MAG: twin-arginine translocase TatA/TatE family subunit [Thermoanaerobaculia bacterium]